MNTTAPATAAVKRLLHHFDTDVQSVRTRLTADGILRSAITMRVGTQPTVYRLVRDVLEANGYKTTVYVSGQWVAAGLPAAT